MCVCEGGGENERERVERKVCGRLLGRDTLRLVRERDTHTNGLGVKASRPSEYSVHCHHHCLRACLSHLLLD